MLNFQNKFYFTAPKRFKTNKKINYPKKKNNNKNYFNIFKKLNFKLYTLLKL